MSDKPQHKGFLKRFFSLFSFIGHCICKFVCWYLRLYKGRCWWFKILIFFVSLIVSLFLYVVAVMFNFLWLFGKSPSAHDIMHPKNPEASVIYSADGKVIGKFFDENRQSVSYKDINSTFFQALISTEDERFYEHRGIDFKGLIGAAKDAVGGHARGASTISQQLVKNMFRIRTSTEYGTGLVGKIPGMRILIMKTKEMVIAVQLEMSNEKDSILTMYANTVDFGSNAFGIKTAAKTYFNKTPAELRVEEAAVLVGLLKATSTYNPRINPQQSQRRRNVVLDNIYNHRHDLAKKFGKAAIETREQLDSLKKLPIELNFNVETAYDGQALYFRQAVADYIKENSPNLDPYTDGLKIYTTLDSRMQRYAEAAVVEQMKKVQDSFDAHWRGLGEPWRDESGQLIPDFIEKIARETDVYKKLKARFPDAPDSVDYYMNQPHEVKLFDYDGGHTEQISTMDSIRYMVKFMHTGFVAMEPGNGHVKVYVGDVDFKTWKYDKVRSMRQPGSTFKLFVYATAMKQGWTPSDARLKDAYIRMEVYDGKRDTTTIWQPHNANGRFSNANLPLRSAFAQSVNTIAVKLGQEVGIGNVIETAQEMGILSPLSNTPSLALGSSDVNLLEMVNAYATVANGGVHVPPVLVEKIIDREGKVVYEAAPSRTPALDERAAFFMQKLLEAGVRDGGGTSQALGSAMYMGRFNGRIDFGGKTGTSNNHSDAWFIGVTPALVGGAWVGGEYRSIHFRSGRLGQGSRTALPIFGLFMNKLLNDPLFAPRYLKLYGKAPQGVTPAMYGYTYVPREEPDSLSADSILLLEEDGQPIEPSEAGAEISSEQASQSGKSRQGVTARDKRNNRRNGGDEPNPEEYYE
mgnify:FL=1